METHVIRIEAAMLSVKAALNEIPAQYKTETNDYLAYSIMRDLYYFKEAVGG